MAKENTRICVHSTYVTYFIRLRSQLENTTENIQLTVLVRYSDTRSKKNLKKNIALYYSVKWDAFKTEISRS